MEREIAHRLWFSSTADHAAIGIGPQREPLLSFAAGDGRVRTSLVLLGGVREIDLSGHPAAAVHLVRER
ncbi:MAG: hypothetical protein QOF21_38, partial [Actinomycetota bacterium]